ncbi:MAG: SUMF1/EgtB/PvdO family nonheme iron enzyme [Vicinamibacteria bacterium]|jgi:hypothetical protein|nr:SUMF1/EgtB/PvdO family nonheme iron enzyme [Vicinamibacteria bacterium]
MMRIRIVAIAAATWALYGLAAAGSARPLKQAEIVYLLQSGVSTVRIANLVKQYGVDFTLSSDGQSLIVMAGGDKSILDAIKNAPPTVSASQAATGAGTPIVVATPAPDATSPAVDPSTNTSATTAPASPQPLPLVAPRGPLEPILLLVRAAPRGDIYMSQFEITNKEFSAYCHDTRVRCPDAPYWGQPDRYPVVNISWHDANAYCRWLSRQTGHVYRLPYENEWEFAARGGLTSRTYPWGDAEPKGRSCYGTGGLCRVGTFSANAFSLHDMAGSVYEWCGDIYRTGDKDRIIRGGSWSCPLDRPDLLAVTARARAAPDKTRNDIGMRVVREP